MERDSFLYKARRKCQVLAHKVVSNEAMSKLSPARNSLGRILPTTNSSVSMASLTAFMFLPT